MSTSPALLAPTAADSCTRAQHPHLARLRTAHCSSAPRAARRHLTGPWCRAALCALEVHHTRHPSGTGGAAEHISWPLGRRKWSLCVCMEVGHAARRVWPTLTGPAAERSPRREPLIRISRPNWADTRVHRCGRPADGRTTGRQRDHSPQRAQPRRSTKNAPKHARPRA